MRKLLPIVGLLAACSKDTDTDSGPAVPPAEVSCPGDPACADNTGQLQAGVAVASVVPTCFETWADVDADATYDKAAGDTFSDCGCDRVCPDDPAWTAADSGEGDGVFQAAWIAGFGSGRAATGVRGAEQGLVGEGDGLWARTVVLRDGDTTLAIASVDLVGWFFDDVLAVRERVRALAPDVDHVIVHSTHTHQGVDTVGLWGRAALKSGYTPEHRAFLIETIAQTVADASQSAVPVSLRLGRVSASSYDAERGIHNVLDDARDPWVVIDDVGAAQLIAEDGATVATLVSWACHPETRSDDNTLMSSDFAHALRRTVEGGAHWQSRDTPGVGGVAIYLNGAVGGMQTALHTEVHDPDGGVWSSSSWEKADAQGILLGEMALDALGGGETVANPDLSFQARELHLPVENMTYQTAFLADIVVRELYDWDPTAPIEVGNIPHVRTEVDRVDLGPLQILTAPGEVLPEVYEGGYDGSHIHAPGVPLIDPNNPNPPDLAAAPAGPYWRDRMGADHRWLVGLANDELGYVIPPYDFVLADSAPWFTEAEGDHYEETNSLGPQTQPLLEAKVRELFAE